MDARQRAEAFLRTGFGAEATFHPGQWEAIEAVVVRRQRALVVQRTGWGKSLVYFLATRVLRELGSGPTLINSPLLALMRDQLRMADRLGLRSATLNSANTDEWSDIEARLAVDDIDVLLVSPEWLGNDRFVREVLPSMIRGVGLLVIDEAHCISDWGHDFRPDYRRIISIVRQLPSTVPVLATTATANSRVVADVQHQLGEKTVLLRGPLMRESLRLQAIELKSHGERLAWLAEILPTLRRAGIIYAQTVADAQQVSGWLQHLGFDAPAYYGGLADDARRDIEQRLLANELDAVVATTALGMGFDKPDLGFVIHYQRPGSVISFYQQIGRAGRAIPEAHAILLHGDGDDDIQSYFVASAFPAEETFWEILNALEGVESLTARELGTRVNASYARIDQALKLLELDGAVSRDGSHFSRTVNPWQPDTARIEGVQRQRWHELQRMRDFCTTSRCLMQFIAQELDDPTAKPCGQCANCRGDVFPRHAASALRQQALAFLRSPTHVIPPRKQLPPGTYPERPNRSLDPASRLEEGRALATWGDAIWGTAIRRGKYETARFDDELVHAAATLIAQRWQPEPFPTWVAAVPSLRRPELVADFAGRLASALSLPYLDGVLLLKEERKEQKLMQNSAQQMKNIVDAVVVRKDRILPGPVLLVDDIVDSRWTLTVCGAWLRRAGSGPVFPFALAKMPAGAPSG